jgi:hypothetical protein
MALKQAAAAIKNGMPGIKGSTSPTTPTTESTVPANIRAAFLTSLLNIGNDSNGLLISAYQAMMHLRIAVAANCVSISGLRHQLSLYSQI